MRSGCERADNAHPIHIRRVLANRLTAQRQPWSNAGCSGDTHQAEVNAARSGAKSAEVHRITWSVMTTAGVNVASNRQRRSARDIAGRLVISSWLGPNGGSDRINSRTGPTPRAEPTACTGHTVSSGRDRLRLIRWFTRSMSRRGSRRLDRRLVMRGSHSRILRRRPGESTVQHPERSEHIGLHQLL